MKKYRRDPKTYEIIGAAFEVHRQLGPGFSEEIYQEALAIELKSKKIPFNKEVYLPVFYKGELLKKFYRADFVCFDEVMVEIKALNGLTKVHEAQLLSYLKATGKQTGLLINFGSQSLQHKRRVF